MPRSRRVRNWIVLAVVGIAVTAGFLVVAPTVMFVLVFGCFGQPDSFDAGGWRAAEPGGHCSARTNMVDDVLADQLQPGRDRTTVEQLLGPTEYAGWVEGDHDLAYVIDCWIDCNLLVIEFDDADHLVRAYEAQD